VEATDRRKIRLSRKQAEFRRSTALYRGFVGGRGSGKSWAGAYDMIRRLRPDRSYLIGSPTGVLMQDTTYPTFKALAQELGIWAGTKLTPYPTAAIRLEAGTAEIRFRTADEPERMRGPNLAGAWLDEASLMHAEVRRIVYGSLRSHGELGWLTATFTPKGMTHWTYEAFAAGLPRSELVRSHTRDNPFNSPEFVKTLQEQYGDTLFARQELGGEFVALEGAEFPAEWFARPSLWFEEWPEDLMLKVIALDPSKGTDGKGEDYQAHVLLGVATENGRYVYYVDADLQREGVVQMCDRTALLVRQFNAVGSRLVDSVFCEENGTMGLLQPAMDAAAVKAGLHIPYLLRSNTEGKEFRIRLQCGAPLSRFQLRFRNTPGARMLVGQLQSFPKDERDDGPDALASALRRVAELLSGVK
jgi:phage terminase large subunit-like protein